MKVGVVTPYCHEPLWQLERCLRSVRAQTYPAVTHFTVGDGDNRVSEILKGWSDLAQENLVQTSSPESSSIKNVTIPGPHSDNGDCARSIGGILAMSADCDAVAYLDADNYFDPEHIQSLVQLHRKTGADVCHSRRRIETIAGKPLLPEGEPNDKSAIDTSCFFITRSAFHLLPFWAIKPREFSPINDHIMAAAIRFQNLSLACTEQRTVAFCSRYNTHYEMVGQIPPVGGNDCELVKKARRNWIGLTNEERIKIALGKSHRKAI